MTYPEFKDLVGYTLREVKVTRGADKENGDQIEFFTQGGEHFRLYHAQDCCESVWVEDIAGSLDDLIGLPILLAEEAVNPPESPTPPKHDKVNDESRTWTFYKLATNKGRVTIRWCGESNGYYSESVDFEKVEHE